MIEKNDWRLMNQMNYLYEKPLLHIPYRPYRDGWEHDHCAFCSDTIDEATGMAYCTTDEYHWICEACFDDFVDMFRWKVVPSDEKPAGRLSLNEEREGYIVYYLGGGEIVPGVGIGPFKLGMTLEEVRHHVTEYDIEDRTGTIVLVCGDIMFWIEEGGDAVRQILVYGCFGGQYKDAIGIGSTLTDVQERLHATWHENLDTYVLDDAPGMCFELGDSGDDTYWDELAAPIEMISVYPKDRFE